MELTKKIEALEQNSVIGEIVGEDDRSVRVRAGGAVLEIARRHVADKLQSAGGVEVVLTKDAVVVVSTVVSAKRRFVASDVFGALYPSICADNCNCNCGGSSNCNERSPRSEQRRNTPRIFEQRRDEATWIAIKSRGYARNSNGLAL